MRKILAVFLLFALLVAPVHAQEEQADLRDKFRDNIVVNKSHKDDVLEIMGEPHIKEVISYSNFKLKGVPFIDGAKIIAKEIWTYVNIKKEDAWKESNVAVTLGGVVFAHDVKLIVVFFDAKGKVIGYQISEVA